MSKFIEIHIKDSRPRLINTDEIRYITGKTIVRSMGTAYECMESYEELKQKLIDAGSLNNGRNSCK